MPRGNILAEGAGRRARSYACPLERRQVALCPGALGCWDGGGRGHDAGSSVSTHLGKPLNLPLVPSLVRGPTRLLLPSLSLPL